MVSINLVAQYIVQNLSDSGITYPGLQCQLFGEKENGLKEMEPRTPKEADHKTVPSGSFREAFIQTSLTSNRAAEVSSDNALPATTTVP